MGAAGGDENFGWTVEFLNAIEMGIAVGEAEIGGAPEAGGFLVSRAGFLRALARGVDPVGSAVADAHRHIRAFDDRRARTRGEQHEGCNAGAALLPEPDAAYLCHMFHIAKNSPAGR